MMAVLGWWRGLVMGVVYDALNLPWAELHYRRSGWVLQAAVLLAAVFLIKVVWRKRRRREASFYQHSGFIFDKSSRLGMLYRTVRGAVGMLAVTSLIFLGIALADPAVLVSQRTEQIESREIVYVKDVSASMGFRLQNSDVSRGAVTYEMLTNLLLKRRAKKDRAALVTFGTEAEVWSYFTMSVESLLFSASNAPIAIADSEIDRRYPGDFILKKGQWLEKTHGGGTSLHLGLQTAIYLFEQKGSPGVVEAMRLNPAAKMRSVVIITDGAADFDPEPQFIELRKQRIVPYLVFVDPNHEIEKKIYGPDNVRTRLPDQLLMMVKRGGGAYFFARDRQSVERISEALDRLHTIKKSSQTTAKEKDVYYIPLALAFLSAAAALLLRAVSWSFWRTI